MAGMEVNLQYPDEGIMDILRKTDDTHRSEQCNHKAICFKWKNTQNSKFFKGIR